ncbi:MAG TPA: hypothetical protein VIC62_04705 [Nakamurella sp.]|jgi:hypothetical protein
MLDRSDTFGRFTRTTGEASSRPASTTAYSYGGTLKSGSVSALALSDDGFYQVNPKTTTRPTATTAAQPTITVASAAGFPTAAGYFVRIDNEVLQVTAGQGTTTWTVLRGQLGTSAATHLSGATVSALATDWHAGFTGIPGGSANLKISYGGRNCGSTTLATCAALTTNVPAPPPRSSAPGRTRGRCASWCTPNGGRRRHRPHSRPGTT